MVTMVASSVVLPGVGLDCRKTGFSKREGDGCESSALISNFEAAAVDVVLLSSVSEFLEVLLGLVDVRDTPTLPEVFLSVTGLALVDRAVAGSAAPGGNTTRGEDREKRADPELSSDDICRERS
jgi:hypothetical protein